jgi:hypothetical protein
MSGRANKDVQKAARKQGWRVERCGNNHLRFIPPDPEAGIIHTGGTDQDVRARRNLIAEMRRTGCFVWAGH